MSWIRRPQRKLTAEERDVVARVESLCLHRMLHLGLVDPVPNPSPMSEAEGAWVREHAFSQMHRHIERGYAWGFWRWSFCEKGTCWNCLAGRCEWCMHRQKGGPDVDNSTEWFYSHRGIAIARFLERPGGEQCVWWCRCPCPKTGEALAKPKPPTAEPEPRPAEKTPRSQPAVSTSQATLFDQELISQ